VALPFVKNAPIGIPGYLHFRHAQVSMLTRNFTTVVIRAMIPGSRDAHALNSGRPEALLALSGSHYTLPPATMALAPEAILN
jgi:hypothetical protein